MLRTLTPNLMVEDVPATADWYRTVLGFEVVAQVPEDGGHDFAIIKRDDVQLMLQSRASLGGEIPSLSDAPIRASMTLYLQVSDIASLRRQVDGKTHVLKDLHDTFYGTREFYVTDRNGYILGLAEDVSAASPGPT